MAGGDGPVPLALGQGDHEDGAAIFGDRHLLLFDGLEINIIRSTTHDFSGCSHLFFFSLLRLLFCLFIIVFFSTQKKNYSKKISNNIIINK